MSRGRRTHGSTKKLKNCTENSIKHWNLRGADLPVPHQLEGIMAGRNLSGEIYETLANRIKSWRYLPGHRFTEEDLCREFSVSRSPVREALNMLVEANLIQKEERKGYRVRKMDLRELIELYNTRLILELAVIDMLCDKGIPVQTIQELKTRWEKLQNALPAMAQEAALEDERFHEALAEAADNRVIQRLLKEIDQDIRFVRLSDITDQERLKKTCSDHLRILAALEAGDRELAKRTLSENIIWGRDKVASALKDALIHACDVA